MFCTYAHYTPQGRLFYIGKVIRAIGEKSLKEYGFQHTNSIKCINGTRKSHKGYTWSKEEWSK